jgi:hypothetical protein
MAKSQKIDPGWLLIGGLAGFGIYSLAKSRRPQAISEMPESPQISSPPPPPSLPAPDIEFGPVREDEIEVVSEEIDLLGVEPGAFADAINAAGGEIVVSEEEWGTLPLPGTEDEENLNENEREWIFEAISMPSHGGSISTAEAFILANPHIDEWQEQWAMTTDIDEQFDI